MIVPALLTDKRQELERMLVLCKTFCSYVQIDIMDGSFVPTLSVSRQDLSSLNTSLPCEAHLMVRRPQEWIEPFRKINAQRIIFHYEIEEDKSRVISQIRAAGMGVGIAINPDTPVSSLVELVDKIDVVLFMSVVPGFYGSPFIPEVLDKIKEFKTRYPDREISIDGGIKLDNVASVSRLGVNYICVGSALLKAPCPQSAFKDFIAKTNE